MPVWLRTFFTSNEKVLTGAAAIATVLALIATVAALLFTGAQIELARKTVEAQTVYQLQKDGRELLKSLFQNDHQCSSLSSVAGRMPFILLERVPVLVTCNSCRLCDLPGGIFRRSGKSNRG